MRRRVSKTAWNTHFYSSCENSLHSLHQCRKALIVKASWCNAPCFPIALIAPLVASGAMSDKGFYLSLHQIYTDNQRVIPLVQ